MAPMLVGYSERGYETASVEHDVERLSRQRPSRAAGLFGIRPHDHRDIDIAVPPRLAARVRSIEPRLHDGIARSRDGDEPSGRATR